ncbi:MAG: hypothetical protein KUA37_03565 [Desulfomicrobium sp.]|nr:hypothetical protein [Pseudomonadota bacterium]MBU4570729.1 hypothetical protein [Pseudomonadota bacterium]MBV1711075.1 hypothetical protein [Desulfomicrobium sp.]MBV1719193.1 hypothetical protein [Desulfomicrobium sp.]MBV1749617.1 hypothetical protein [Desulfomicrobium sp.]
MANAAYVRDAQTGGLAQNFGKIDARRIMNHFDFVFVGFANFFGSGGGVDPEAAC